MRIATPQELIERAKEFAKKAHQGQERKDGSDYFTHLERVAGLVDDPVAKQAAYLHDVIEDTLYTEADLLAEFPEEVVRVVLAVSRHANETYFDFILRVQLDPLAVQVKVADLTDNMSDVEEGSLKDKYRFAYYQLTGKRPEK